MKTIFLIHDGEESPAARQNVLEMAGFSVKLFKSGRELFLGLKDGDPDLVLMDVLLDGRNGFETVRELDARVEVRRFPVMLCTRIYGGHVFQEEAMRCGAQDYLVLPMDLEELVQRVNDTLDAWGKRHGQKSGHKAA